MENIEIKKRMDEIVESIKEKEETINELEAILEMRIKDLKQHFKTKKDTLDDAILYLKTELRALFEQVEVKETRTQYKVALLSGDVVVKKPKKAFNYDKKLLEKWAEKERPDLIEVKEMKEFRWVDFKEELVIHEDRIINISTGEMVEIEGLSIKEVDEQIIIR